MTQYDKIAPLGQREGHGTFDTFFDTALYKSIKEATDANDYVIVDFVKDKDGIVYFEIYHVRTPKEQKHHRLIIQHFPCGVDVQDDQTACEIATSLFITPPSPQKESIDAPKSLSEQEDDLLRKQAYNESIKHTKPIWKTHTLRWLFYRRKQNMVFGKNGWSASQMCKVCKKGVSSYMSFMFTDAEGKVHHKANCPFCGADLKRVKNTTLIHKLYLLFIGTQKGFWWVLDSLHIVRNSTSGRYDMFGDERRYVKHWSFDKEWNPQPPTLKNRKWWEYILIEKSFHKF